MLHLHTSTFASKKSADEYVDTAIARNIQHSLRCYQYEGHFRHLRDLYEKGELTSAINRVVEDINHRFTLEVLSQDWKSHDIGISASNLRRDRKNPTDILDHIDLAFVTYSLRKLLEIRNRAEQTVALDDRGGGFYDGACHMTSCDAKYQSQMAIRKQAWEKEFTACSFQFAFALLLFWCLPNQIRQNMPRIASIKNKRDGIRVTCWRTAAMNQRSLSMIRAISIRRKPIGMR